MDIEHLTDEQAEIFLLKRDNNILEESCREYETEIAELKAENREYFNYIESIKGSVTAQKVNAIREMVKPYKERHKSVDVLIPLSEIELHITTLEKG